METLYFMAKDGTRLCYSRQFPLKPKRILLFSHGAGEYPQSYAEFFNYLNSKQVGIYAIHHRGHGLSEGKRGHINHFEQYVDDLKELYDLVSKGENTPDALMGHSMGGLIATKFCLDYPEGSHRLILSAPAYKFQRKIPLWIKILERPISIIWPTFSRNSGLGKENIDPLFVHKVSARWLAEFEKMQKEVAKQINRLKIPTLLFHSQKDQLASFEMSKELFTQIGTTDKYFKEMDFDGHNFNSSGSNEDKKVIQKLVEDWIYEVKPQERAR